ncbi:MAG: type II secretion system F family protein [Actinomycetota bacterium]
MIQLAVAAAAALALSAAIAAPSPRLALPHPTGSTRRLYGVPLDDRVLVGTVALLATAVVLGPVLAVAIAGGELVRRWWSSRRRVAAEAAARVAAVPELVELVALALRSGSTATGAVDVVASSAPGPAGAPFQAASARLGSGLPAEESFGARAELPGTAGASLAELLLAAGRQGAPISDAVTDLAQRLRADRRRALQRRVQRLPVLLLAPLTLCVLPSFVLIVCVPLVVTGLSDLG